MKHYFSISESALVCQFCPADVGPACPGPDRGLWRPHVPLLRGAHALSSTHLAAQCAALYGGGPPVSGTVSGRPHHNAGARAAR